MKSNSYIQYKITIHNNGKSAEWSFNLEGIDTSQMPGSSPDTHIDDNLKYSKRLQIMRGYYSYFHSNKTSYIGSSPTHKNEIEYDSKEHILGCIEDTTKLMLLAGFERVYSNKDYPDESTIIVTFTPVPGRCKYA